MLLTLLPHQYKSYAIMFGEPIKNNIINNSLFSKILYCDEKFTTNGICILVHLTDVICEKYYNKFKCNFNISQNNDIIQILKQIEKKILSKYITKKTPVYKIYENINSGYLKHFTDIGNNYKCDFILKISGIWETEHYYGLTFKFVKVDSDLFVNPSVE